LRRPKAALSRVVTAAGGEHRNAAWTYRHPSPLARKIKNHVAFWGPITVTEQ